MEEQVYKNSMEKEDKMLAEYLESCKEEEHKLQLLKDDYMEKLKDLINTKKLVSFFEETLEHWHPEGIVDIELTDQKTSGYASYQLARVKNDPEDRRLYIKTDNEGYGSLKYYYVWQTTGYLGDDYSGYMLFPLKDGRFFKVSYSC